MEAMVEEEVWEANNSSLQIIPVGLQLQDSQPFLSLTHDI
jgi:hypothetical protein